MICKSCGGTFAKDATKCPYCGTMHLAGATKAYNQKFEDMTDDLADLGEEHIDEYKKTIRRHGKRTIAYICIASAIVGVFVAGMLGVWQAQSAIEDTSADETKARIAWQAETFTMLDALYDAGDFDTILAFENDLYADATTNYSLYYWSHSDFLDAYRDYAQFTDTQQNYAQTQTLDKVDTASALHFYLVYSAPPRYYDFTEGDLAFLQEYTAEVCLFLQEALALTQDDLLALQATLADEDGWISFSDCYDYIETALT